MNRSAIRHLVQFVAGIATVLVLYATLHGTTKATRESGQRSLIFQVEHQLMLYYGAHDRYPDSLQGMHFNFTDGANEATLERLEYFTDGAHYRLVTKSDFDGTEISACK